MQSRENVSFRKRLCSWIKGPVTTVVFTIGVAILGVYASGNLDEISGSAPFTWIDGTEEYPDDLSREGITFWSMLLFFTVLGTLRELWQDKRRDKEVATLSTSISEVEDIASTMPPKSHLHKTAVEYETAVYQAEPVISAAWLLLITKETQVPDVLIEKLDKAIRFVLDYIINLAIYFDQPDEQKNGTYSANIMWVKRPRDIRSPQERTKLWQAAERLSDCDNETMFMAAMDAFLVLDTKLTTSGNTLGKPVNDQLKELCLGYKHGDKGIRYNLPGAPMALADNDMSYVPDSEEIWTGVNNCTGIGREKIKEYYQADKRGKSILSMPIAGFDSFKHEYEIIAVLSIYRDRPGIMGGIERARMFYYQMSPSYLSLLFRLCQARSHVGPCP